MKDRWDRRSSQPRIVRGQGDLTDGDPGGVYLKADLDPAGGQLHQGRRDGAAVPSGPAALAPASRS